MPKSTRGKQVSAKTDTDVLVPLTAFNGLVDLAIVSEQTPHGLLVALADICKENGLPDIAERVSNSIQTEVNE